MHAEVRIWREGRISVCQISERKHAYPRMHLEGRAYQGVPGTQWEVCIPECASLGKGGSANKWRTEACIPADASGGKGQGVPGGMHAVVRIPGERRISAYQSGRKHAYPRMHLEGRAYQVCQVVNGRYACQSTHAGGKADQRVSDKKGRTEGCMPEDASGGIAD
jgi:hypothetical protein